MQCHFTASPSCGILVWKTTVHFPMCGLSLLTSPPRAPIVTDQERFKAIGLIYPLFLDSKQMFCSLPVLQNSCETMYFRWSCNHIKTAKLKSDLDDFKWGSSSLSLNRWPKTEMQWMQTLKTPGWWYVCIVVVEQCGFSTSLFLLTWHNPKSIFHRGFGRSRSLRHSVVKTCHMKLLAFIYS